MIEIWIGHKLPVIIPIIAGLVTYQGLVKFKVVKGFREYWTNNLQARHANNQHFRQGVETGQETILQQLGITRNELAQQRVNRMLDNKGIPNLLQSWEPDLTLDNLFPNQPEEQLPGTADEFQNDFMAAMRGTLDGMPGIEIEVPEIEAEMDDVRMLIERANNEFRVHIRREIRVEERDEE
tara:strand:- start:1333 stop:1875 length:543 start_codon:yes stop_codon:yes gene_type:complete